MTFDAFQSCLPIGSLEKIALTDEAALLRPSTLHLILKFYTNNVMFFVYNKDVLYSYCILLSVQ